MRPKRPEEIDGVDYHFRSKKYFSSGRKNGIFFECQEVRKGKWYGSEFTAIEPVAKRGLIPVVTLDVEGAKKMLTESRVHAEIIYVLVSKETLLVRAEMIR